MEGENEEVSIKSFEELGVCKELAEACDSLGWKNPSKIQCEAIPHALEGKDLIGLAKTGSGKTGAFALPILQALLEAPHAFFACVLSPTRELAIQIAEQFEALGSGIGVKCAVLVGGVDQVQQSIAIGKRPHIVGKTFVWAYEVWNCWILPATGRALCCNFISGFLILSQLWIMVFHSLGNAFIVYIWTAQYMKLLPLRDLGSV